jgi:5-methylcytosine-specific restriction endonuclease McrA
MHLHVPKDRYSIDRTRAYAELFQLDKYPPGGNKRKREPTAAPAQSEEDKLIAEAERTVAERRRARKLDWARSVLATEGQTSDEAATSEGVRAEMAQDRALAWRVFARDGYRCQVCEAPGGTVELTVDHIIPVSAGGTNAESNLQTLCRTCNSRKGARIA